MGDESRRKIKEFILSSPSPVSFKEIVGATKVKWNDAVGLVRELFLDGEITRTRGVKSKGKNNYVYLYCEFKEEDREKIDKIILTRDTLAKKTEEDKDVEPESLKNLMIAIITGAVSKYRDNKDKKILSWFKEEDDNWIFSCSYICEHIGLSRSALISELKEGRRNSK